FRLFLWLLASFRNASLAALASAFLSIAAAVSAVGCAGFFASLAQRLKPDPWGRPSVALGAALAFWVVMGAPGFVAGPDQALNGLFGFVGLLRKEALDYTTPIALLVLGFGFSLERSIRRLSERAKATVSLVLGVCTIAGASTAASDRAR